EANHGGGLFRKQVDDLSLAFVTPLSAEHHYTFTHCLPLPSCPMNEWINAVRRGPAATRRRPRRCARRSPFRRRLPVALPAPSPRAVLRRADAGRIRAGRDRRKRARRF